MRCVAPLALVALTAMQPAAFAEAASSAPSLPLGRDWALTMRGDFRPRLEVWRDSARNPHGASWDAMVTQRARLGAELAHRNRMGLELTLQDVHAWGAADGREAELFEVHTANLTVPVSEQLALVVGRQEFEVGHDRVLGADDFDQRGRSVDGLKLNLTAPPAEACLFYAKLREGTVEWYPGRRIATLGDRDVAGIVSRTALVADHFASVLFLVDGDREADVARYTFGGIFGGRQSLVRYWAEAYGQSGVEQHDAVQAYFFGTRAEFASQRRFAPSLALWLDHASGDGSRQGSFDVPLGSHHEYFGALDLFVDLPGDTGFGGLTDFGASAGARPHPSVRVAADWHHFSTRSRSASSSSGLLGQEVDVTTTVELADFAVLEGLAAVLFPGERFDDLHAKDSDSTPGTELGGFLSLRARL